MPTVEQNKQRINQEIAEMFRCDVRDWANDIELAFELLDVVSHIHLHFGVSGRVWGVQYNKVMNGDKIASYNYSCKFYGHDWHQAQDLSYAICKAARAMLREWHDIEDERHKSFGAPNTFDVYNRYDQGLRFSAQR